MPQISRSANPKILYIDDDATNRSLVNRLLTSYNFEVIEAATGLEGITIAKKDPPQLILMDINMPGLDGHETTTRMRSIPVLERVPIIAVTARSTSGERELALAAGCDGYITKPIDVDDFPQQVMSYLDGYKDTITNDERQIYLGHYSHKLVERLEAKVIELEEANNRLQKIDKLKSDFITLAAHELRTPITLVYGYARLLQLVAQETEPADSVEREVAELAGRIYYSVQRLNEVVNDVLNISLIEANEMRLQQEPVNLAEVIDAALQELNPSKNNRVLNITLQGLDTLPAIIGDADRLRQAFWNILSNAIKYTPNGGSISVEGWRLSAYPPAAEQPTAPALAEEDGVIILVKDSGIGINHSELKDIFEHFYIVGDTSYHSSSKTAFGGGGIGLGLPITRGIIEAHDGRVWAESEGRDPTAYPGSKFYVILPLKGSQP
ncbi:MAG: hybrid sensor histidine kinase/response regulator [Chloroflexi bacterium]|nr:hybrid sensor histidine kinase/response regulator [Chloroflexota bacterium]